MKRFIEVTTQFEGFHYWSDAPIEVAFLKKLHRHMFHVRVMIEVSHNNRALEFFIVKHFLEDFIKKEIPSNLGQQSCEMIAEKILDAVKTQYRLKKGISVVVREDNENGGGVMI